MIMHQIVVKFRAFVQAAHLSWGHWTSFEQVLVRQAKVAEIKLVKNEASIFPGKFQEVVTFSKRVASFFAMWTSLIGMVTPTGARRCSS